MTRDDKTSVVKGITTNDDTKYGKDQMPNRLSYTIIIYTNCLESLVTPEIVWLVYVAYPTPGLCCTRNSPTIFKTRSLSPPPSR